MFKVEGLIGLAYRAGMVVISGDNVLESIDKGKIHLILIAKGLESNLVKKVTKKAESHNIKCIFSLTEDEISESLGNKNIKIIGITDLGFSKSIIAKVEEAYGKERI